MKTSLPLIALVSMATACTAPQAAEDQPWSLDDQVELTRELLSERLRVPPEDITLKTAELVTFPDGAAGCPRPGMAYTQALVEGYRVVMVVDGREYHYHGHQGGAPFYCAKPASKSGWIQDR